MFKKMKKRQSAKVVQQSRKNIIAYLPVSLFLFIRKIFLVKVKKYSQTSRYNELKFFLIEV